MKSIKGSLVFFFLLFAYNLTAQKAINLIDSRKGEVCSSCNALIDKKPKEVLFGIHIDTNQDVYFVMDDIEWFKKILQNDLYGIAIDFIGDDRYDCNKTIKTNSIIPLGVMLPPVFKKELLLRNRSRTNDVYVKIGKLPSSLKQSKIEGNLVIVIGDKICFYTNFVNINRSKWNLLPMGLFSDTLINKSHFNDDSLNNFTYTKKTQIIIPFFKGSSSYNSNYIDMIDDSVDLKKYRIQRIDIRAYSSIEGSETLNMEIMNKRGEAMIRALKPYQSNVDRSSVVTSENWLEFFADIKGTEFEYLQTLSKSEIKSRLTDPVLEKRIESLLSKERKVVANLYLEPRISVSESDDSLTIKAFKMAVRNRKLNEAQNIQKEVIERIKDNKLPLEYLNKLEVPQTKDFSLLMNDREVYKYIFRLTSESEALNNFLFIKKLNPKNGHINYNICALKLIIKQFDDEILQSSLLKDIILLSNQGIDPSLVKRMVINYNILKCEDFMKVHDYESKDSVLTEIHDLYDNIEPTDDEIYSMARYYSYYSYHAWAMEVVIPRIGKIDADENVVFYYLNLLFFHPEQYESDNFIKASLNAVNLNKRRYCDFFLPIDEGGASMQLLEHSVIRNLWCQQCRQ